MRLVKGDLINVIGKTNYLLVTTNAVVKNNGAVVMGRGFAKTLRDRYPDLDYNLGQEIKKSPVPYGIVWNRRWAADGTWIGAFQVKYNYKDAADLTLITFSTDKLKLIAESMPDKRFDMNFPGIGNGRLGYDDVLPILQQLPDNVFIWTFK